MDMSYKPKVFFTSNVFSEKQIGSNEKISENLRQAIKNLWQQLCTISEIKVYSGRFPSQDQITEIVKSFKPDMLGCHLSHTISQKILKDSKIFSVSTSTAGYDHIQRTEKDNILITHTPGILHKTVADYTIAIIMARLRNLIELHNYVWNDQWKPDDKWDLDKSLCSVITDKTLGIIGLGEIGKELVKKLYPWEVKILYHDIKQMKTFEEDFPSIKFKENLKDIFQESDIITLHLPLNKKTHNLVDKDLLKLMKKDTLLINTARGGVLNIEDLLELLEKREIQINIALDVFPIEPIDNKTLMRFKKIKENQPYLGIILLPHNASADANIRAKMNIIFLQDIIKIIKSSSLEDLKNINLIPEHKNQLTKKQWNIFNYWKKK
jgi:phosphoglycerate dehydrogenase-like enzyme